MSILAILAKLLRHQAELAETLAIEDAVIDIGHRQKLRDEILLNAADFQRFVAQYKIQIEKRTDAPTPAGVCAHCLK